MFLNGISLPFWTEDLMPEMRKIQGFVYLFSYLLTLFFWNIFWDRVLFMKTLLLTGLKLLVMLLPQFPKCRKEEKHYRQGLWIRLALTWMWYQTSELTSSAPLPFSTKGDDNVELTWKVIVKIRMHTYNSIALPYINCSKVVKTKNKNQHIYIDAARYWV